MATVTLRGETVNTVGDLPALGSRAPEFTLTRNDLTDATMADYAGKKLLLSISPSLDTPVCSMSIHRFNEEASSLENTKVLHISEDLPFAQKRFCGAEEIDNVETLSAFRYRAFANGYGVRIMNGPMKSLLTRAIIIIDTRGKVIYTELVPEITREPDYEAALAVLR